jgi:hypothetical protein
LVLIRLIWDLMFATERCLCFGEIEGGGREATHAPRKGPD